VEEISRQHNILAAAWEYVNYWLLLAKFTVRIEKEKLFVS
jgi:hypothetical protein